MKDKKIIRKLKLGSYICFVLMCSFAGFLVANPDLSNIDWGPAMSKVRWNNLQNTMLYILFSALVTMQFPFLLFGPNCLKEED